MNVPITFRYEAVDSQGRSVRGTIDAASEAAGREQLNSLALTVRHFEAAVADRVGPLGTEDLTVFNEQLAQLARAGLPVEEGLRLLALDMSRGKLKRAVDALSADLAQGKSLSEAIARQRSAFPPLYANLVEAGIRCNNLPGVLFGLSRHLDLTRQIRSAITRAVAYPAVVLIAILCISALLSAYVLPQLLAMFDPRATMDWGMSWRRGPAPPPSVPMVTVAAQYFGLVAPFLAGGAVATALLFAALWPLVRSTSFGRWMSDQVLTRLPLVGRPLRYSLVGRWCDVASIGVGSGLDLPTALTTAADAVGSSRLHRDTRTLIETHSAGRGLDSVSKLDLLPTSIPGAMQLALGTQQLAQTLATLRDIYLRQAQTRARMIPMTLMPILILLMAILIGGILMAVFVPILRLLNNLVG